MARKVTRPVDLFLRSAAAVGNRVAVIDAERSLTYNELGGLAQATALELRRAEVRRGDPIIVACDRACSAVVAMLALAWTNAAFVPIDLEEPVRRVEAIVAGADAAVAIVDGTGSAVLPASLRLVEVAQAAAESVAPSPVEAADPMYILFTSGSTGAPKGVVVPVESLSAFLHGALSWAGVGEDDVMCCFHAFTFDISIWEIWGALAAGATVVIAPRVAQLDAAALVDLVDTHHVTRLCQTPTALRQLGRIAADRGVPSTLRTLFVGGERLDFAWLTPFADALGAGSLTAWNLYGPTEATIYATGRRISASDVLGERRSLIGRSLPHVTATVRDGGGDRAGSGVVGEIDLEGPGVATGYRNATADGGFRWTATGTRVFMTGDLGRLTDDGEIEFVGRAGGFVKIRGFRVEPNEIAIVLAEHPAVADAAAVDVGFLPGGPALAAAVVPGKGSEISEVELRRFVATRLPAYARPARIVFVDELPRLSSSKLDRDGLRDRIRSSFGA